MKELKFEWDEQKNKINKKKHGISFEEAQTVFYDEYAIQFYDPDHSEYEERYILLGTSLKPDTLIVCHCYRQAETVVRVISARKADKDEAQAYWSNR
ncbi:BrnT family toxin [Candidatus Albibeggiatoa sp. nov. BB20]|uniref:BrnT family toxin n=1 Tax=Candidatus Albibeggiatoa sp. nov. BB20 TaxID=3162723 RepID=UPI003365AEE3